MRPRQTTTRRLRSRRDLLVEPWRAVAQLLGSGLVAGRRAADDSADPEIGEFHAVVAGCGVGLRGEARFVEHGIEEIAGAIAGERPTGAVGAVGAGSEAQREDARRWDRRRRAQACPSNPNRCKRGDARAQPRRSGPQPRASIAGDDAGIEGFERAGSGHNGILLDNAIDCWSVRGWVLATRHASARASGSSDGRIDRGEDCF